MYPEVVEIIERKYGTQAEFARQLGWTKQRLYKSLHAKSVKAKTIKLFAETLDMQPAEMLAFFLKSN